VTGAGGFCGGHLVARLVALGHQVFAVDRKLYGEWHQRTPGAREIAGCDLSHPDNCRLVTRGQDWVFNLAADMGGMGFIEANKAACMLSVLPSTNMLVAAWEAGVERFFYSSSACVYPDYRQGRPDGAALVELDAYPAMPEDGYGWEKLFTERMCRHFTEDYALPTRVARYHNVYGPHGTWTGGREKAPAAICRKVAEAVLSGDHEVEIWGDGEQTRSFMYVDDCIAGTLRLMASDVDDPVNIGSSELVTINGLVDIVEDIAGVKLRRRYNLDAPTGVRGRNSDNTTIRNKLGWEPSISLREGLELTYAWIYDQVIKSA
jgi:GDP-D-mannose 3', 5'-epimerase